MHMNANSNIQEHKSQLLHVAANNLNSAFTFLGGEKWPLEHEESNYSKIIILENNHSCVKNVRMNSSTYTRKHVRYQ
jgi:hypothetical protein